MHEKYFNIKKYWSILIFVHFRTFSYIFVHFRTFSYIFVHYRTFSYIFVHYRTFSYIFVHFRTFSYIIVHYRTFSYIFVFFVPYENVRNKIIFWLHYQKNYCIFHETNSKHMIPKKKNTSRYRKTPLLV